MEKQHQLVNSYEKEYMKLAMLEHEQAFREQVHELHRLYQIQKALMKNIKMDEPSSAITQRNSSQTGAIKHTIILDLQQKKLDQKLDLDQPALEEHIDDETEIELTLGLASYNSRRKRIDNQTPLSSNSGPSCFSSSSTGSSNHLNKKRNVNIGSPLIQKMMELKHSNRWDGDLIQNEKIHFGFDKVDQEEQLRQERLKQPPWLLQALSLNMTLRNS